MTHKAMGRRALGGAARVKVVQRGARLAAEAANATAALRDWLASAVEPKAGARGTPGPAKNPGFQEEVAELLQHCLAIQLSVAELGSRPELASGLIAVVRYSTARRAFSSDAEMAETLEVHRSQITRWKQGAPPDLENAERLVGLDAVVSLLRGFLDEESIPKWLRGINAHLEHRKPIDVLREGRLSEVIRAIEAEKSGAFA